MGAHVPQYFILISHSEAYQDIAPTSPFPILLIQNSKLGSESINLSQLPESARLRTYDPMHGKLANLSVTTTGLYTDMYVVSRVLCEYKGGKRNYFIIVSVIINNLKKN